MAYALSLQCAQCVVVFAGGLLNASRLIFQQQFCGDPFGLSDYWMAGIGLLTNGDVRRTQKCTAQIFVLLMWFNSLRRRHAIAGLHDIFPFVDLARPKKLPELRCNLSQHSFVPCHANKCIISNAMQVSRTHGLFVSRTFLRG